MKGFATKNPVLRKSKYWISCYTQDNEDEPISVTKAEIEYKPGQNREQKMLAHCHKIFKSDPGIWEALVHQGPSDIPESGDQIVARLSREPFDGADELTVTN
jgi:hypothetical protein